jgi:NAD(P)-dependent dehydrogenase (short-subunit alcohol dehydrogenase family)
VTTPPADHPEASSSGGTAAAWQPLAGRTALVAGTGPGIGAGIAVALARSGARVACVDVLPAHAEHCAQDVADTGAESVAIAADLTDEAAVEESVQRAEAALGVVDVLVNGVAVMDERSVLTMDYPDYLRQLTVILGSAFLLTRAVARRLVALGRPGAVVHLASTAGHQGQADNIGYCTAKAGLLNFARSATAELGPHGIRVNTLTPTTTDPRPGQARGMRWGVPVTGEGLSGRQRTNERRLPLGRLPTPDDYGAATVFLVSDAAALISGTDLRVDAGALASYWAWSAGDRRPGGGAPVQDPSSATGREHGTAG